MRRFLELDFKCEKSNIEVQVEFDPWWTTI